MVAPQGVATTNSEQIDQTQRKEDIFSALHEILIPVLKKISGDTLYGHDNSEVERKFLSLILGKPLDEAEALHTVSSRKVSSLVDVLWQAARRVTQFPPEYFESQYLLFLPEKRAEAWRTNYTQTHFWSCFHVISSKKMKC